MSSPERKGALYDVLNDLDMLMHDLSAADDAILVILPESTKEWTERDHAIFYIGRALDAQSDKARALVAEAFRLAPDETKVTELAKPTA